MKPDDLKRPFQWVNRHILIQDRIWYVPDQYEDQGQFVFPGWTHPQTFAHERPICIEYCSGNGAWIAAKAQANPQQNWVAVELKFERVRKIWAKIKNQDLSNLFVICGEGHRVTQNYFPSASVHSVFINFPDPWPKNRHAKHRLVQVAFVREIERILQPHGTLTLVTDDPAYSEGMIHVMQQIAGFQSVFEAPYYVKEYPDYGTSYFEDLWRQKGKSIRYHAFRKIS